MSTTSSPFDSGINDLERYRAQEPGQLQSCWALLDKRFGECPSPAETRLYRIAGLVIRLECRCPNLLRYADVQLSGNRITQTAEPDVTILVWHGSVEECLPEHPPARRIEVLLGTRQVLSSHTLTGELRAYDPQRARGYLCIPDDSEQSSLQQAHVLHRVLYMMAKNMDRLFLHAAAIGYEGRGVLICGRGGQGKSTLALSSLLTGCSFVADDHLILSRDADAVRAWPIYSVAALTPQMLARMPELQVGKRWVDRTNRKYALAIPAYHDQFAPGLAIRALVFPEPDPGNTAEYRRTEPGKALSPLIWSTIRQAGDMKDPALIRYMMGFFAGMPCYSLKRSVDIQRNALLLKQLILEEID